ncbi:PepSY domain-containing protein [Shewanella gelidimarina]|uniref:PepSY domain-containing protein n=1 Tax=Shewanella gelidimarina TaxID=56813 RepID=UPI00200DE12E|nr:PepSY domain-containing protein [Shewanella gelidimarina]MCL1057067.1 PepSY domain-containing protein [Shewanella gelidimarina]
MLPESTQTKNRSQQRKRMPHWIKVAHYWIGALVSIQLLLWLISGLYFNLTPHDEIKGMVYNHSHKTEPLQPPFVSELLADIAPLLAAHPQVEKLRLLRLGEQPVYVLDAKVQRYKHQCQQQTLIDAYTGKTLTIDKPRATQLARDSYQGPGTISTVERMSAPFYDWPKQCNPLWQIAMEDDLSTRIYINAINGELVGHKNDQTDIADLMFKLHFMDYLNQGSFNNLFSWLFALLTLLLSLSGLYWVAENIILKRYKLAVKRVSKKVFLGSKE